MAEARARNGTRRSRYSVRPLGGPARAAAAAAAAGAGLLAVRRGVCPGWARVAVGPPCRLNAEVVGVKGWLVVFEGQEHRAPLFGGPRAPPGRVGAMFSL